CTRSHDKLPSHRATPVSDRPCGSAGTMTRNQSPNARATASDAPSSKTVRPDPQRRYTVARPLAMTMAVEMRAGCRASDDMVPRDRFVTNVRDGSYDALTPRARWR